MTNKEIQKFNIMVDALTTITKYMTTKQIGRENYGLDYTESLEMAYDNIKGTAKFA